MSPKDDVDDAPHPTAEEADLAEPVLVPPRGLWAVALALFVLSAAAAILWAPPLRPRLKPSLVLDTWRNADIAGMRAADDALLKRVPTAPEQVALEKTILAQFGQFLQREATLSGQTADDPAARLALGAAEESVRALVQRHGRDALSRMAVQFGRDVRAAVDKSLIASRAAQQPFAQRLVAQPLPEDVSALAALAGALGPTLERTGIERQFHDGHLDPAAGQVIETIAQMRFLLLGARVQGGPPQLSSTAMLLVQHFRLEAHSGLELPRRLALLDELATADPAYPSDYARGVLLAREEEYAKAVPWFLRASTHGPFARQARDNARWCQERAEKAAATASQPAPAP